jgi:hypothetical protein
LPAGKIDEDLAPHFLQQPSVVLEETGYVARAVAKSATYSGIGYSSRKN